MNRIMENSFYTPPQKIKTWSEIKSISRKSISLSSSKTKLSLSRTKQRFSFCNENLNKNSSLRDEQLSKYFNTPPAISAKEKVLSPKPPPLKLSQFCIDDVENIPPNINMSPFDRNLSSSRTSTNSFDCDSTPENRDVIMMQLTPKPYPGMEKIQRDLNSPSARARVRAMQALKSPTKINNYCHYDVPKEQMDIITDEERRPVIQPQSIQEVMKDVVVYVEIRSGNDNRSAGIKRVISQLGAKINNTLLRSTTHVLFKDGLHSTYKKAKLWNIPLVSILWIEACKRLMKLPDPKYYPISNIETYENPNEFRKIKRFKSMQPKFDDGFTQRQIQSSNEDDVFQDKAKKSPIRKIVPAAAISVKNISETKIKPSNNKTNDIKKILFNPSEKNIEVQQSNDPIIQKISKPMLKSTLMSTPKICSRKSLRISNQFSTPKPVKSNPFGLKSSKKLSTSIVEENTQSKNPTIHKQNTIISNSTMDQSIDNESINNNNINRRETEYSIKDMEESYATPIQIEKINRRRTLYTPNSFVIEENKSFVIKSQLNQADKNDDLVPKNLVAVPPILSQSKQKRRSLMSSTIKNVSPPTLLNVQHETRSSNRRKTIFNFTAMANDKNNIIEDDSSIDQETQTPNRSNKRRKTVFNFTAISTDKNGMTEIAPSMICDTATPKKNYNVANIEINKSISSMARDTKTPNKRRKTVFDISTSRFENDLQSTEINSNEIMDTLDKTDTFSDNTNETSIPKKRKLYNPEMLILSNDKTNETLLNTDKREHEYNLKCDEEANNKEIGIKKNNLKKQEKVRTSDLDFNSKILNHSKHAKTSTQYENKQKPIMVLTNMHKSEINVVKEAIKKFGYFELQEKVNDKTTHLITLEPRRTLNLLRGIIRGVWILSYDWILDSIETNGWLLEEQYEVRNFSRAVEICRSERQAFGSSYKIDIFVDMPLIYVSPDSKVPKKELKELIKLCSGKLTEDIQRAKYCITENYNECLEKSIIQVKPDWILDCITETKIKKINKYLLKYKKTIK